MTIAQTRRAAMRTLISAPLALGLGLGLGLGVGVAGRARAAAPFARTPQPGFYRMKLGDFEVTALNDGVIDYETTRIAPAVPPGEIAGALRAHGLKDPVGMSYNGFLINTGRKLVLIDTGTGGKMGDDPGFRGAGHLVANLRAAGYRPEQVDEVLITHRGPDHIGGLTLGSGAQAKRTFPNATLRAPKDEFDLYLDPARLEARLAQVKTRKPAETLAYMIRDLIQPYVAAGRYQGFTGDEVLTPGINALATHGHTPGHTAYVVENRGEVLIVMGDVIHLGALQFAHPETETIFDSDPAMAVTQRRRVLSIAADTGAWVAGGHVPFPGIGHVRTMPGGFAWVPVEYAAAP